MKYDAALSKNKKSSEGNELFLYIKERKNYLKVLYILYNNKRE